MMLIDAIWAPMSNVRKWPTPLTRRTSEDDSELPVDLLRSACSVSRKVHANLSVAARPVEDLARLLLSALTFHCGWRRTATSPSAVASRLSLTPAREQHARNGCTNPRRKTRLHYFRCLPTVCLHLPL